MRHFWECLSVVRLSENCPSNISPGTAFLTVSVHARNSTQLHLSTLPRSTDVFDLLWRDSGSNTCSCMRHNCWIFSQFCSHFLIIFFSRCRSFCFISLPSFFFSPMDYFIIIILLLLFLISPTPSSASFSIAVSSAACLLSTLFLLHQPVSFSAHILT